MVATLPMLVNEEVRPFWNCTYLYLIARTKFCSHRGFDGCKSLGDSFLLFTARSVLAGGLRRRGWFDSDARADVDQQGSKDAMELLTKCRLCFFHLKDLDQGMYNLQCT